MTYLRLYITLFIEQGSGLHQDLDLTFRDLDLDLEKSWNSRIPIFGIRPISRRNLLVFQTGQKTRLLYAN